MCPAAEEASTQILGSSGTPQSQSRIPTRPLSQLLHYTQQRLTASSLGTADPTPAGVEGLRDFEFRAVIPI